jgi:myo-inositol-1(or 4)-monophosphatase
VVTATSSLVRELAVALRDRVAPMIGSHDGRAHAGRAGAAGLERGQDADDTGDVTFAIDAEAERFLADQLARRAPDVAFFSEDRGLVVPGASGSGPTTPATVLIVDPIDGTRPALAGLESCCVSVAAAPLRDQVTMGEVTVGCVVEIPSGTVFLAERGRGLVEGPEVRLSSVRQVDRMFWTHGFRGRPARALAEVLGDLIDASSVGGASFDLGSAAYGITRVACGQLDAYVEPGPRMVAEVPGLVEEFRRVGGGAVLNNSPYDLAAAVLCLTEAGGVVTDAAGRPLDERPLLGSGQSHQMSVVAAANEDLHGRILEAIDEGIERLRRLRAPEVGEPRGFSGGAGAECRDR